MAASESGTSAPEAGAPEDEIEIIPEIIDAGADVIWRAFDGTIPQRLFLMWIRANFGFSGHVCRSESLSANRICRA